MSHVQHTLLHFAAGLLAAAAVWVWLTWREPRPITVTEDGDDGPAVR